MMVRYGIVGQVEIAEALHRYRAGSDQAARAFLTRLDQAVERMRDGPRTYPLVERGRRGRNLRYITLDKFPYALFYEVLDDEIVVLGLWHTKSRGEDWSRRET